MVTMHLRIFSTYPYNVIYCKVSQNIFYTHIRTHTHFLDPTGAKYKVHYIKLNLIKLPEHNLTCHRMWIFWSTI